MLRAFHIVAYLEGASLLVLLFIAMPLKYAVGFPLAVKVVGTLHGGLFIAYVAILAAVSSEQRWPGRKTLIAFAAASLPGGTFLFERSRQNESNQPL